MNFALFCFAYLQKKRKEKRQRKIRKLLSMLTIVNALLVFFYYFMLVHYIEKFLFFFFFVYYYYILTAPSLQLIITDLKGNFMSPFVYSFYRANIQCHCHHYTHYFHVRKCNHLANL